MRDPCPILLHSQRSWHHPAAITEHYMTTTETLSGCFFLHLVHPCPSSSSITPCNKAHRIHQTQQYNRCLATTDTTPPFSSQVHSLSPALLFLLISDTFYTSHNTDPIIPVRPTPLPVHFPSSFRCILKTIPDKYGFDKTYYVVRAKATFAPGYT